MHEEFLSQLWDERCATRASLALAEMIDASEFEKRLDQIGIEIPFTMFISSSSNNLDDDK